MNMKLYKTDIADNYDQLFTLITYYLFTIISSFPS